MEKKRVSIIIPAYNVEQYITRCLQSTIIQTYPEVEIVVIDDGSTDRTWDIIQEFCKADERIIGFKQNNCGVSTARNAGIDNSTGDYCVFLDSDDWLEANTIEYLLKLQSEHKKYFICASAYYALFNSDNNIIKRRQKKPSENLLVDLNEAMNNIGTNKYNLRSACYKLFAKERISNIRFDEEIYHGEDGLFVFRYLSNNKDLLGLCFSTVPLWNVLDRPGSATKSSYNNKWLSSIKASEMMLLEANDYKIKKSLVRNLINRTEIVEKEIIKSRLFYSNDFAYTKRTLIQYQKDFIASNPSIKEYLKYYFYILFPPEIIYIIVNLLNR